MRNQVKPESPEVLDNTLAGWPTMTATAPITEVTFEIFLPSE